MFVFLIQGSLTLLLLGGGKIENPFQNAKKMTIEYAVQKKKATLEVDDPKQIKEIVSTVHIGETVEGTQVGLKPTCTVEFTMADKTRIKIMFVKAGQLDRFSWGQIYLKDAEFYDKINEILSKKEGRKIDLLTEN
jgi:hypothetical protein